MQQHTVVITLDAAGNPVPLSADGTHVETTRRTKRGDQIQWKTSPGTVFVDFQPTTPFQDGAKGDETFRALSAEVSFTDHYTFITPDKQRNEWPENQNGVVHVEESG